MYRGVSSIFITKVYTHPNVAAVRLNCAGGWTPPAAPGRERGGGHPPTAAAATHNGPGEVDARVPQPSTEFMQQTRVGLGGHGARGGVLSLVDALHHAQHLHEVHDVEGVVLRHRLRVFLP